MRYLLAVLLFAGSLQADVKIPARYHVENRPPGTCQWRSLETMGTFLGYQEFSGLADWYHERGRFAANQADVRRQLEAWDIAYRTGDSVEFIKRHTDRGLPVLIGFHKNSYYGDGKYGHAAVVVNVTKTRVFFCESNMPGDVFSYSLAEFREQWDGYALAIEGKPCQ